MYVPRKILLNPGPCTTSKRVKRALVMPDLCPREAEFGCLVAAVRDKIGRVACAPSSHSTVLLAGSGTAAVETALASSVGPADLLLIIDNGVYGQRAELIAHSNGLACRVLRLGWGVYPEPDQVAAALDAAPRPTHCFLVHHETSTGMLNPLSEVAALCQARGVSLIVDAISSLGGVPIDLSSMVVDILVGSPNKCLQGFPGLAFALCNRRALARSADVPRRSLCLHLNSQWRAQEESSQFQFTPPVQVVHALDAALDEYFAEGAGARHRRYAACCGTLVSGMEDLGFSCLLPARWRSGLLTAFREPDDPAWSFAGAHDYLFARDITVYPGVLPGVRTFRIANIGALDVTDIGLFLGHLGAFLDERGMRTRMMKEAKP